MKKRTYNVMSGAWGKYGQMSPITRDRAKRLIKKAIGVEKHEGYGYAFILPHCPTEVAYCQRHGAAPEFRLLVWA